MAIDAPARVAVLGGGPIGLEAALYGRFLGYQMPIYERGRVCENIRRWGHVTMFTPAGMNVSPLGLAALKAQDPSWQPPPPDAPLTGRQLVEAYYLPLSRSDLVADFIHEEQEVVMVGRDDTLEQEAAAADKPAESQFRILLRGRDGQESVVRADAVIDATGTYGNPNWLGQGGNPAIGELQAAARIEYGLPDVLGEHRARYAGKRVLVVGSGCSAATTVVACAALASGTEVTWVTRREPSPAGPLTPIPDDPLPQRAKLAEAAGALAQGGNSPVRHWPATWVHAVGYDESRQSFEVELAGQHGGKLEVDQIVANVGYRPCDRIYGELRVMPRSAARETKPDALRCPEPNFYVLGAKSYGRDSRFLLADGLRQIRDVFAIVGDRSDLDLYATMHKLP